MLISYLWLGLLLAGIVSACFSGQWSMPTDALLAGAGSAVALCVELCGALCLWSGILEVLRRSGLSEKLAALLRPVLKRLMPAACGNAAVCQAVSANVCANILGLGNAATPLGIQAVRLMSDGSGAASDDLCLFAVLNTASIQLLPTTVAALRSGAGAVSAFDILPAVWITSAVSVCVGVGAARLLARRF